MDPLPVWVDDSDNGINWSGPWSLAQDTMLNVGTLGPPYKRTLHTTRASASLSFEFRGTQVEIMGVNQGDIQGQSWECLVDGQSIGRSGTVNGATMTNWVMCSANGLSAGTHTIQLVLTVSPGSDGSQRDFFIDAIRYTPTSDLALSGRTVLIRNTHPLVRYSSGWSTAVEPGIAQATQVRNSFLEITFSGTSLTWLAMLTTNLPEGRAVYSIDGGRETAFTIPSVQGSFSNVIHNQLFFQTGTLSPGRHVLRATYHGDSSTAPLILGSVLVNWQDAAQGSLAGSGGGGGLSDLTSLVSTSPLTVTSISTVPGGNSPSQTGSGSLSTPTGEPNQPGTSVPNSSGPTSDNDLSAIDTATKKTIPPLAVAGLTAGCFLLLLLLVGLLFWRRRKRRARRKTEQPPSERKITDVDPYPSSRLNTHSTSSFGVAPSPSWPSGDTRTSANAMSPTTLYTDSPTHAFNGSSPTSTRSPITNPGERISKSRGGDQKEGVASARQEGVNPAAVFDGGGDHDRNSKLRLADHWRRNDVSVNDGGGGGHIGDDITVPPPDYSRHPYF